MCYKFPGPRCSNHAEKAYIKAKQDYYAVKDSKDEEVLMAAKKNLVEAENHYYMTPKGQENLRRKIANAGGTHDECEYKLEYGIMAREEALAAVKAVDKGDIEHHPKTDHAENRRVRLDEKFAEKQAKAKEELADENARRKSQGLVPLSKYNHLSLDTPTSGYASYESSLIPEAANLEQVGAVVDSVEGGANTAGAIAASVGIKTNRGGNYYANAANYIGLIQKSESDEGHEYELTPNGKAYHDADPSERAALMRELVNATPIMQAYVESGKDRAALEDYIRSSGDGHEASVAKRRASSLVSWHEKVNSKGFTSELSTCSAETQERAVFAAAQLKADRAAKEKLAKLPVVKDYGTCSKCYTKLPASGKCFCDE